jgi:hypothetical protein
MGVERPCVLLRPVPIACRHVRPTDPDLADFTWAAAVPALRIDNPHLVVHPGVSTADQRARFRVIRRHSDQVTLEAFCIYDQRPNRSALLGRRAEKRALCKPITRV